MGQQGFIQLPIFHCTEQGDRMKSIRIGHHLLAGKHPKNTEISSRLSQIIPLRVSIGLSCWADGVCVLCRKQVNVLKDTEENRTNWISGLNFTCMKDNWSHHICQAKAARRLLQQARAQGRKDRSCMEALINTKKWQICQKLSSAFSSDLTKKAPRFRLFCWGGQSVNL